MRTEMRKIIGAQLVVVQEDNGIIYHDLGDFRGDINMYIILYNNVHNMQHVCMYD